MFYLFTNFVFTIQMDKLMKHPIRPYTFYKNKYGSELLIDIVELKNIKKYLLCNTVHTLTYYDITFITEGKGSFSIDNRHYEAAPGDVLFSGPGEVRDWDIGHIINGYALIFEEEFLSSFFKDSLFVQHLSYFQLQKTTSRLHLPEELYMRMLQLLQNIKREIDSYQPNEVHILRALLYEALMLLDRSYKNTLPEENECKGNYNIHFNKFIRLVDKNLKEQHSVQFYADSLCITPNYLNEIVNATLQINAKQYIRNKVMDEAKKLLIYTNMPISEIAFELHFSTVSYFIRSFRQYTGETPLLYRQKH